MFKANNAVLIVMSLINFLGCTTAWGTDHNNNKKRKAIENDLPEQKRRKIEEQKNKKVQQKIGRRKEIAKNYALLKEELCGPKTIKITQLEVLQTSIPVIEELEQELIRLTLANAQLLKTTGLNDLFAKELLKDSHIDPEFPQFVQDTSDYTHGKAQKALISSEKSIL